MVTTGKAGARGVERSASAVFASPDLKAILGAPRCDRHKKSGDRSASGVPTELGRARDKLRDMAEPFVKDIAERSAASATTAVTGALNFGFNSNANDVEATSVAFIRSSLRALTHRERSVEQPLCFV
jgi:hypothetical protein